MTVKHVARYNRICKALESKVPTRSPTSVVGLITENVLVPIKKTVFVEKSSRVRSSFSERTATKAIRLRKRDDDATIPLLKQPPRQPSKRLRCHEKKRTSNDNRNSTLPLFNNTAISRRPRDDKKTNVLPFPSPISANASIVPELLPPRKRRKTCKNRVDPDRCYADYGISVNQPQANARFTVNARASASTTNLSISVNSSNLSNNVENIDSETATRRALRDLQKIDWLSTDTLTTIFDKAVRLLETDSFGIPVAFTVATTPARRAKVTTVTVTETEAEAERKAETETETVTVTTTETEAEATTAVTTTPTDVCRSLFNVFDADKLFGRYDESNASRTELDDTDRSIVPNAAANLSEDAYPCKFKYSWQVLGKNTQTSRTLLEHLLQDMFNDDDDTTAYACSIKYSWQIIGISTQTSKEDLVASRLSARSDEIRNIDGTSSKSSSKPSSKPSSISPAPTKPPRRSLNKAFLTSTQGTQTCAHKEIQTNFIEFYVKE
ncbi:uncharacterized protein LOC143365440 [Halictus rubicundus]|uniref:uncharacterized protein LOC143365440 n=1 Tax=Halictus rubicundus TaxID=77578 RepID=UPI00403756E6